MKPFLATLVFVFFLFSCKAIKPVGITVLTDEQRMRRFHPNAAKLAVLRRAVNAGLPVEYRGNPGLLKHYDYWPIAVDHQYHGLWHFDNYSHRGPILVINGKHTAAVVPFAFSKEQTLDSLNVALRKYPLKEINQQVRDEITRRIVSMYP
ncbi:hypothetical protein LJY25_00750 [Hymenobacter sp. BT175]|uniref:hypothetical protein n=1 Tax=Hymenobacter translucens TaxID=2886507 RepID=UPI001D0F030D|nr:hypothetical protein [Hymenobacter translucens]MCC2544957.1 hypothetical protein [Hymenobacter translucens]